MRNKLAAIGLLLAGATSALAQGQLPAGTVWGNPTAAQALASPSTLTALFDQAFCTTRGSVLSRQVATWVCLAPGSAGLPLVSGGVGADSSYALLGVAGGGTGAALTPSNGGIVYSTAATLAILNGTASTGRIIRSSFNAAPTWSTATYPSTASANTVIAATSSNDINPTATPVLG